MTARGLAHRLAFDLLMKYFTKKAGRHDDMIE
jgi:hypothetical protein